jgi:hypothetical protein
MLSMVANFNPGRGVYTCISSGQNGDPPLIGQVRHQHGERSARLSYFTPRDSLDFPQVQELLADLTAYAAGRGAFHLLGEAEEDSAIYEQFRRFGFSVYAWQKIWRFSPPAGEPEISEPRWVMANSADEADINWLYTALVPPLVQAANTPPHHPPRGLVYRKDSSLMGFVEVVNGIQGIFLEPLIHPEAENVASLTADLINRFPTSTGRPVYVAVRSYQSWLEPFFDESAGEDSPRHALMVKHFTVKQSEVFEKSRLVQGAKQTVPLAQHTSSRMTEAFPNGSLASPGGALPGSGSEAR